MTTSVSTFRTCETCKRYVNFRYTHTCDPEWSCTFAEYANDPEEFVKVRAIDPGTAAEVFAQDCDDEPCDDQSFDVVVRDGERLRRFKVRTTYSVDYSAREVEGGERVRL